MSPSKITPTLRTRPIKDTAAQVGSALKAAEMVAKTKRRASYAQSQTNTPTPEIADKAMQARISASYAEQPPPNKRFIFKGEVLERVGGVSAVCLWRWMRDGKFPGARLVGGRTAWLESDIDEWMESRPLRQYKSREVA
jgi:predicted DNA-binding transcriptional regulator AlpA